VLDLISKVRALAHGIHNYNACSEVGPFAYMVLPILGTKLDILRYSNKLKKGLYCMFGITFLNILKARLYYCQDVFIL